MVDYPVFSLIMFHLIMVHGGLPFAVHHDLGHLLTLRVTWGFYLSHVLPPSYRVGGCGGRVVAFKILVSAPVPFELIWIWV